MSQSVTPDDIDIRARLRPLRPAAPADSPDGRTSRPAVYVARPAPEPARKLFQDVAQIDDFSFPTDFSTLAAPTVVPTRQAFPVVPHKPEPSTVLRRESFKSKPAEFARDLEPVFKVVTPIPELHRTFEPPSKAKRHNDPVVVLFKLRRIIRAMPLQQRALTALAAVVFLAGVGISLSQFQANRLGGAAAARTSIAAAVPATTTNSDSSEPSTVPVTADTLRAYRVAPDAARYIRIDKLGVLARVLQVGMTKKGALATPSNVFDTAWYKDSAKPGQPGATLIDGHVSNLTTNGVFYGIKNLAAGDTIEIERGDGSKLEYSVVQTTTYPKDAVDMKALLKPVKADKSGLNLITCGGKYDSKSGEFSQRVAVFSTLND